MRIAPFISLGLSVIVGVAAVFLGRGWLSHEAVATNQPAAILVQEVATQKVLVADMALERGQQLTSSAYRLVDWPVEYLPAGAITDTLMLSDSNGELPYALGFIVPGEPLLAGKLSQAAVRDTLAALIEPGFRAVSVKVDDASGVAGFVLPDHRVDVNVFTEKRDDHSGRLTVSAETLLYNIRVLAVDQNFQENLEGSAPARTVTLQVTPEQSRTLGLASQASEIGLALRPQGESPLEMEPPIHTRRETPRVPNVKVKPKFSNIRVIQGDQEEIISAPVAGLAIATGAQNK